MILPPPGYSLDEVAELRQESRTHRGCSGVPGSHEPGSPEALAELKPGGGIGTTSSWSFMANQRLHGGDPGPVDDPFRVRELIPELPEARRSRLPGTFFVFKQSSIFQRSFGEGRNDRHQRSPVPTSSTSSLSAREIFGKTMQLIPGAQGRPIPSLDLGNPEVRIVTHRRRASELGLSNRELGFAVSALVDGAKVERLSSTRGGRSICGSWPRIAVLHRTQSHRAAADRHAGRCSS